MTDILKWHRRYVGQLPVMRLTESEFVSLPEYSCTVPTGVIPGKKWRRHDGSFDRDFIRSGGKPVWLIGQYVENTKHPDYCDIVYYRPIIRVPWVLVHIPEELFN